MTEEEKECDWPENRGKCHVDKSLVPLKLLYLFERGGLACALTFQSVFIKHIGISTYEAGIILSLQKILAVIVSPLLGFISDKTKKPRQVLIAVLLTGAAIVFSQYFIPPLDGDVVQNDINNATNLVCFNSSGLPGQQYSCHDVTNNSSLTCTTVTSQYDNETELSCSNFESARICNDSQNQTYDCTQIVSTNVSGVNAFSATFWALLTLVLLSMFSMNGGSALVDATAMSILGEKNRGKFGFQMLFGSIGAGLVMLGVGFSRDLLKSSQTGEAKTNIEFLPMFCGNAVLWILAAVVALKTPIKCDKNQPVRFTDLRKILREVKAVAFFLFLVMYGFAQGVLGVYVIWFAEVKLNASSLVLGAATTAGCFADFPFLFYSGVLIRKLGCNVIFCGTMILFSIRFYIYTIITEAWMIIPMNLLRGITYGLVWPTAITYASRIAQPGLEATTMGLVYMASWNLGTGLGAMVGGYIFLVVGADGLFIITSIIALVTSILYGLFSFLYSRRTSNKDLNENIRVEMEPMNKFEEEDLQS